MTLQNKYKIALVGYRLSGGGSDKVMANLSCFLSDIGVDVHIVTVIDEINYSYKGTVFSSRKYEKYGKILGRFTRFISLKKYFKQNEFDLIIDFRFRIKDFQEFFIANFVYNAPTYFTVHSSKLEAYIPKSKFWANKIYKQTNCKGIIAVSKKVNDMIKTNYGFNNVTTIYNAYNQDEIENKVNESLYLVENYILAVGQMSNPVKQFDHLIRAFALSKIDAKLVICGEGDLQKQYKKLAKELNVEQKVIFEGYQNNPFKYMKKAKFMVLSSAYEGFPNVLVECLACGTPIVSYDCVSGPNEIIKHNKNGLLVENQNIEKLSEAINKLNTDEELYQHLKSNSIESVAKFELKSVGENWINTLNLK